MLALLCRMFKPGPLQSPTTAPINTILKLRDERKWASLSLTNVNRLPVLGFQNKLKSRNQFNISDKFSLAALFNKFVGIRKASLSANFHSIFYDACFVRNETSGSRGGGGGPGPREFESEPFPPSPTPPITWRVFIHHRRLYCKLAFFHWTVQRCESFENWSRSPKLSWNKKNAAGLFYSMTSFHLDLVTIPTGSSTRSLRLITCLEGQKSCQR